MKSIENGNRRKEGADLRKDVLGQTGALEEGDSFGTADTAVPIQIGTSKIRIEEIDVRRCRCHCWRMQDADHSD